MSTKLPRREVKLEKLEAIRLAILSASRQKGKDPSQISYKDLQTEGISGRQLKNNGGLPALKVQFGFAGESDLAPKEVKSENKHGKALEDIRIAIGQIAKEKQIPEHMVSMRDLKEKGITWRNVGHFGGIDAVKRSLGFVPQENPLIHPENQTVDFIGKLIQKAADAEGCRPSEMVWSIFRKHFDLVYGRNSSLIGIGVITQLGGFNSLVRSLFPVEATPKTIIKQRVQDHSRVNQKYGREILRKQYALDNLFSDQTITKIFKGRIKPVTPLAKTRGDFEEDLGLAEHSLLLSDLHIGAAISGDETGAMDFGSLEESRRLASITRRVMERVEGARIHLLICGDVIDGKLHDPLDGALLSDQVAASISLLSQVSAQIATVAEELRIYFIAGNHDRFISRHKTRAVSGKYDAFTRIIGAAIKLILADFKNTQVFIPKTPYQIIDILGRKLFATHGDGVFMSNPHKSVNVEKLDYAVNRWRSALPNGELIDAYFTGHVHRASCNLTPSGALVVTNGALCPVSPFDVSIGGPDSQACQWFITHSPDNIVESASLLRVGRRDDQDAQLDSIIEPFEYD